MSQNNKNSESNSTEIQTIFNNIASHYDAMNRIMSWGLDKLWRKKVVELLEVESDVKILDLACGTCDLTIMLAEQLGSQGQVTGVDYSSEMLKMGREKVRDRELGNKIELLVGDARKLSFAADKFDYVGLAFALRNIPERKKVLAEMKRVVKPQGTIFVLDIFKPTLIVYRQLFLFYFNKIVPNLGKFMFDQYREYKWLPQSLEHFVTIEELEEIMKQLQLVDIQIEKMMGGVVALHYGKKLKL